MSYGPSFPAQLRRAADFVDKILRGTKPSDIPVEQPTRFELVINLTTPKSPFQNLIKDYRAFAA
jgi:putative ABC transport system substrate-binding protein